MSWITVLSADDLEKVCKSACDELAHLPSEHFALIDEATDREHLRYIIFLQAYGGITRPRAITTSQAVGVSIAGAVLDAERQLKSPYVPRMQSLYETLAGHLA